MTPKCAYCQNEFMDNDRVVFSHKETFVFKPAHVPDTVNAARVSPEELRESRAEHLKTAVVNTFCDWGKATIPEDAFNFRHQWCEPQRTGAGAGAHAVTKHAIRFGRAAPGRLHG
jgi:hypothetical protein